MSTETAHKRIQEITERIRERSKPTREAYLDRVREAASNKPKRSFLGCANLAHGFAACGPHDKAALTADVVPNLGIITAYNDMLSAHQPFETFPQLIKQAAREAGGVAQVAGGVPAMCDGVTQGFAGMELSLFSREVIAMATAVGLSHDMFDAAVYLGVCDKIVPGLIVGALTFGHLPAVFIPAGPMTSGLPNDEKAKTRQLYAEGKVGRAELLESESKSYHGPGTCTFYGTANSNQMLMEIMGLHLPGASFINPGTPLRDALTREAAKRALAITALGNEYTPVGEMIDERSIVNGVVGLNATGGSTNHTIHLIAMAAAAGIKLTWHDISQISDVVPLLARVYPNELADVNHFHAAGGMGFLIRELLDGGLLHEDVRTVWGEGLRPYAIEPKLGPDGNVVREAAPEKKRRRQGSGQDCRTIPANRRHQGAERQYRQCDHQGFRRKAGTSCDRSTRESLQRSGGIAGRFQGGRPHRRFYCRGALSGAKSQWHARTAQADDRSGHSSGSRPARGARHRWASVQCIRQGSLCHPRHAGST